MANRAFVLLVAVMPLGSVGAFAQPADRINEYVVVQQHVPHEVTRRWPVGDKTGLDLLVKRGTSDKQLAELVRWYVSVGATIISIYDNRAKAAEGVMPIATYLSGDLIRCHYRRDELVKMTTIELSPREAE